MSLKRRMPTISIYDGNVRAGCLMSYGQDIAAFHRQAATYVDKILLAAGLSHREPSGSNRAKIQPTATAGLTGSSPWVTVG